MQHFGYYAQAIELDHLDELSASLARQYGRRGDWMFTPAAERRAWISTELARLQAVRSMPLPPVASIAPVAPAALVLPAIPRRHARGLCRQERWQQAEHDAAPR